MPSDIHLKERYMMGGRKTELGRMSPIGIPAFLVRELESFVPFDGDDKAFLRQFKCVAEKAGVHGVTPVCCRHTFITWLSLDGVPVSVLQKAARHTKYQTTLGYTHINIDDVLGAVDNLSRKVPFNML